VDVAARLAWTSAASRRATGKPGAAGIAGVEQWLASVP